MNILFYLRSIGVGIGGIEVVTIRLANKFLEEGHHVALFALYKGDNNITERLNPQIPIYIGVGNKICKENISKLKCVLLDEHINIAINQMGLAMTPIKVLKAAAQNLNVKIVSVYHNAPCSNGKLRGVDGQILSTRNSFKKALLLCLRTVYKEVTSYSMRYVYRHSNWFLVLSDSYKKEFSDFTKIKNPEKLGVQTNPVTIDVSNFDYQTITKKKEVIFVGRIDNLQKHTYRVIDVWSLLEKKHRDWTMTILGDGPQRKHVEELAKEKQLERVIFAGFQDPKPFYKRASMIVLTSEYEGFPLILAEAMSFGVVPIIYNSFSAVYDIVEDGKDGFIIEKTQEGFNAATMAVKMAELMTDYEMLNKMALTAIEKSKKYSIDKIYEQWMGIIDNLTK